MLAGYENRQWVPAVVTYTLDGSTRKCRVLRHGNVVICDHGEKWSLRPSTGEYRLVGVRRGVFKLELVTQDELVEEN